MSSQRLIGISVRPVDEKLFDKAQNEAKRRGISFSRYICQLVRKDIEPWTTDSGSREALNEKLSRPSTETERMLDRVENGRNPKKKTNLDKLLESQESTPTLEEIRKRIALKNEE